MSNICIPHVTSHLFVEKNILFIGGLIFFLFGAPLWTVLNPGVNTLVLQGAPFLGWNFTPVGEISPQWNPKKRWGTIYRGYWWLLYILHSIYNRGPPGILEFIWDFIFILVRSKSAIYWSFFHIFSLKMTAVLGLLQQFRERLFFLMVGLISWD